jgi:TetR/AcrR family transcriptional regulator
MARSQPALHRTVRRKPARTSVRVAGDTSRHRLFVAAAGEFAARGFAGASVDRIAAAARLNKAMIYYHFNSKADLYREILRDMFSAVERRVAETAASAVTPEDKVRGFVAAIAAEAEARPHFPPIWFREIADGGTHLDAVTVRHIGGVVKILAGIVAEGVAAGRFRPVNPLLIQAAIVAPLLLYFASGGLRLRIDRAGVSGSAGFDRDEVVAHVQRSVLGTLEGQPS